jgi:hypothetical protein
MSIHIVKRGNLSTFGKAQERAALKNNGYKFASVTLMPARDIKTNKVLTNLTESEATELEIDLGLDKGSLAPTSKYWDSFLIRMPENELILDDTNPIDKITLKLLEKIDGVAKNSAEARTMPLVQFLITNVEAESKIEVDKLDYLDDAIIAFKSLSLEKIADVLIYLNDYIDVNKLSESEIKHKVMQWRNDNPKKFVEMLGYAPPGSKEENSATVKANKRAFERNVFLNKLKIHGIIKVENTIYKDAISGDEIGDREKTLEFLSKPANQTILQSYKEKLDNKLKDYANLTS